MSTISPWSPASVGDVAEAIVRAPTGEPAHAPRLEGRARPGQPPPTRLPSFFATIAFVVASSADVAAWGAASRALHVERYRFANGASAPSNESILGVDAGAVSDSTAAVTSDSWVEGDGSLGDVTTACSATATPCPAIVPPSPYASGEWFATSVSSSLACPLHAATTAWTAAMAFTPMSHATAKRGPCIVIRGRAASRALKRTRRRLRSGRSPAR